MEKKRIAILGSTGSIGRQTLNVIRSQSDQFEVVALAAHSNRELLSAQAAEFGAQVTELFVESGVRGLCEIVERDDVDLVVAAMVGTSGIVPTVAAIRAGKQIALANKEILVAAGGVITALAEEAGIALLPIDSEHSAIFQCLKGERNSDVARIVLTASGGPFREWSMDSLKDISIENALAHPTWQMGAKNTIDSSTLMNKGLEVIEAHWLFNQPLDKIDVVVHPQSVIHGMVEFVDGSMVAQMGAPSMEIPIQVALTHPNRARAPVKPFDFTQYGRLDFSPPDLEKFRCLKLALAAMDEGGTMPCFMNAANEILVERFIEKDLGWLEIGEKLETLMNHHKTGCGSDLEEILAVDQIARDEARRA